MNTALLVELSAIRQTLDRIAASMIDPPDTWMCDEDKIRGIKRLVADRFRVSLTDLVQGGRIEEFSWPRHVAMFLMREAGLSGPQVGRVFRQHHTSVVHGCRRVSDRMDTEPKVRAMVEGLRQKCTEALKKGAE